MPTSAGPNILGESNLVFNYDIGDIVNSYKGEPTTNLVGSPFSVTSGYATTVPTRTDNVILNWNGQNTGGLLSGSGYFAYVSAATTNGNQYTTSWYIKGGTLTTPYFGWGGAHQGNRTNFTFNTDTGVFSGVSQAAGEIYGANSLGNGWWRVYYSSTLTSGNNYYPELNTSGIFYVGSLQIEQKNHPTQFVNGTRSNTQGLLDISGYNRTINLANMSFNSSAQMIFDGTDDYIPSIGTAIIPAGSAPYTVSVWVNRGRNNVGYEELLAQWTYANSSNSFFFGFNNSNVRFSDSWNDVSVSGAGNTNVWMNLVGVNTGTNAFIYLNGALAATKGSALTYTGTGPLLMGRQGELAGEYFLGSMNNVQIYNRALTAAEVLNNYNELKTRFNLS